MSIDARGFAYNSFCYDLDNLAIQMFACDSNKHINTYFALGLYDAAKATEGRPGTGRSAEKVVGLKALWVDIDIGHTPSGRPKTKYETREEATDAIHRFLSRTGLPLPLGVLSGSGGWHLYWPFTDPVSYAEWKPVADQFKKLCKHQGFLIDQTRTSDAASVLRPPDTRNWKRIASPTNVKWEIADAADTRFEDLAQIISKALPASPMAPPKPSLAGLGAPPSNAAAIIQDLDLGKLAQEYKDTYAVQVAERCGVMEEFKRVRGDVSEPVWHDMLCLMSLCVDGTEVLAHSWSSGHPKYDESETARKWDRVSGLQPRAQCAILCETIARHDEVSHICATCPHLGRIRTPLSLGTDAVINLTVAQVKEVRQVEVIAPKVPGFHAGTKGELMFIPKATEEDPTPEPQRVTSYPFYFVGLQKDEDAAGPEQTWLFKRYLPCDGWQDISVAPDKALGREAKALFANVGVNVRKPELFKLYLTEVLDLLAAQTIMQTSYSYFGWKYDGGTHPSGFLIGHNLYAKEGKKNVSVGGKIRSRAAHLGPTRNGNLELWKDAVDKFLDHDKYHAQAFTLLCAFAAPLMHFISSDEGGAILALFSGESGRGKSVALGLNSSVWGDHRGVTLTAADTAVFKEVYYGYLAHMSICTEELLIDKNSPQTLVKEVTMFTAGSGKGRGTPEGGARASPNKWNTILITASNYSTVDALRSAGNHAQTTRVFEITPESPMGGVGDDDLRLQGNRWLTQLHRNGGYAGDAFMTWLVRQDFGAVHERVNEAKDFFHKKLGADDNDWRFHARLLAVVHVAGMMAKSLGLISFDPHEVLVWALKKAVEKTKLKGTKDDDMIDNLCDFLTDRNNKTVRMYKDQSGKVHTPEDDRAPSIDVVFNVEAQKAYVKVSAIRAYLERSGSGITSDQLIRTLKKHNIASTPRQLMRIKFSHGQDFAGRVWVVDMNHERVRGVAHDEVGE